MNSDRIVTLGPTGRRKRIRRLAADLCGPALGHREDDDDDDAEEEDEVTCAWAGHKQTHTHTTIHGQAGTWWASNIHEFSFFRMQKGCSNDAPLSSSSSSYRPLIIRWLPPPKCLSSIGHHVYFFFSAAESLDPLRFGSFSSASAVSIFPIIFELLLAWEEMALPTYTPNLVPFLRGVCVCGCVGECGRCHEAAASGSRSRAEPSRRGALEITLSISSFPSLTLTINFVNNEKKNPPFPSIKPSYHFTAFPSFFSGAHFSLRLSYTRGASWHSIAFTLPDSTRRGRGKPVQAVVPAVFLASVQLLLHQGRS